MLSSYSPVLYIYYTTVLNVRLIKLDYTSITFQGNSNNLTIYNEAFENCYRLKEVIFSGSFNNVIIEEKAFKNCTNLDTIVFPQCTMDIESTAFESCPSVTSLLFLIKSY